MLQAIVMTFQIADAVVWPEDFGNFEVFHQDLIAWECTHPAPPQMQHIAYECELWRYDYGDDDGDE